MKFGFILQALMQNKGTQKQLYRLHCDNKKDENYPAEDSESILMS